MPGLFGQLHQDHINYSRLLNLLEINLQTLASGGKADNLVMRDILKYMVNYPDIHHHPTEEFLFEELGELDNKDSANIEKLCEEHQLLVDIARDLEDLLHKAISGQVVSRDDILELGYRYIEVMRNHIMLEEREVFPLLEASLSTANWEKVARKIGNVTDPVFDEAVSDEYRRLFESITEQQHR